MHARTIKPGIQSISCVHWERRLFDALIPLPDGTSYNAYLVQGQDATALIDSADPALTAELMEQLKDVDKIDYIISQHSEQDHAVRSLSWRNGIQRPRWCAMKKPV